MTKVIAQTDRLLIRSWSSADGDAFFELSQDDGFNQFSITKYRQPSLNDARKWVEKAEQYFQRHGIGVWAVIRKKDDALIGICGLRYYPEPEKLGDVEVTYRFIKEVWGQGYGTEAALACVKWGLSELKLSEIIAVIDPKNHSSKKILRKLGMTYEGNEYYRDAVLVQRYSTKSTGGILSESRTATVVRSYKAAYSDPIRLTQGETLQTFEERESEWEGWLWCTNAAGVTGWVPKRYLKIRENQCRATCDYDATELTADVGAKVAIEREESGWFWGRTGNGDSGWIPKENLRVGT